MSTTWSYSIVGALVLFTILLGVSFYELLPEQMATHFNVEGNADSFTPKFFALLFAPVGITLLSALLFFLPSLSSFKESMAMFRGVYNSIVVAIIAFLSYLHVVIIVWNMGYEFAIVKAIVPPIGILLIIIGYSLRHTKRNSFMGIRTPWTLSSDSVWDKTHHLGSELFMLSGALATIAFFTPSHALALLLYPLIGSVIFLVVYSFVVYQEERKTTVESHRARERNPHSHE